MNRQTTSTAALSVEQLDKRINPSANWNINGINEVVFDPLREIVYIPTRHGAIERYDQAHHLRLTPWQVGSNLLDADITPDGNTLVVAEGNTGGQQLKLYRINLNTAAVTTLTFPSPSNNSSVNQLVMMSDTIGYFTTKTPSYYQNESYLYQLNLNSTSAQELE